MITDSHPGTISITDTVFNIGLPSVITTTGSPAGSAVVEECKPQLYVPIWGRDSKKCPAEL